MPSTIHTISANYGLLLWNERSVNVCVLLAMRMYAYRCLCVVVWMCWIDILVLRSFSTTTPDERANERTNERMYSVYILEMHDVFLYGILYCVVLSNVLLLSVLFYCFILYCIVRCAIIVSIINVYARCRW